MKKCNCCGAVFEYPDTREESPDYVPNPFGLGSVPMGGGTFECCPECGNSDFDDLEFDGENCPYCDNKLNLDGIEDLDNCEIHCEECQCDIIVINGEFQDE